MHFEEVYGIITQKLLRRAFKEVWYNRSEISEMCAFSGGNEIIALGSISEMCVLKRYGTITLR